MLEGNRHEKVAIIITSYVIGFTTAFIAFGLNQLILSNQIINEPLAVVQPKQMNDTDAQVVDNRGKILSVSIGDDGLYAVTEAQSIFLSANKNALGSTVIGSADTPGFHFAVLNAEVSPDGNYVYFCEQLSQSNTTCDPYVYALSDGALHVVKVNGVKLTPEILTHNSSWSGSNTLTVNGNVSTDQQKPWVLGAPVNAEAQGETVEVQ